MSFLDALEHVGWVSWMVVLGAVLFDLANGWNDASNAIATAVCTRVLKPVTAVLFGAALNFAGALVTGAVAKTVGREIADPKLLSSWTYVAALVTAPAWITLCTWRGLPVSCSHSLMGSLVGAVIATAGASSLKGAGVRKIVIGVFTSPVIGFLLGLLVVVAVCWICRRWKPATVNSTFGKLQILSAGYMAFSHGTGDAQKAMGIITGALIAGTDRPFEIPFWVRIICAVAMGVGSFVGGWSVIRTLGSRLSHLESYQGFAAELGAATTIVVCTSQGIPLSTTHAITGSITGVGAARGMRRVRWDVGRKILYAWLLTFPACIAGAFLLVMLFQALGLGGAAG
jgi:PiT family inorganic phosphate transporter